jgi:YVTN family beta-propeller protein
MRTPRIILISFALAGVAIAALTSPRDGHAADVTTTRQLMTVAAPIAVPRAIGHFEHLTVDEKYRRLLAVHTSSNELLVINLESGEVERRVTVGPGHGVAVDVYDGKIFVGTSDGYVSQLNRRWLVENQRIYTNGPVGSLAFDSKNGKLYAAHEDGAEDYVIQGKTDRLAQFPVQVPKGASTIVYDPVTDKLYQNVTPASSVVVIDPATNTVTATWPLGQATEPQGLAVDGKGRRLFSAGTNGKLAVIDLTSGQVTQTIDIPPRADQIAYDPVLNKLYCASGTGLLSVIGDTGDGFDRIGDVTIPRGAHTLAIDPKTHNVWIAYGGDQNDYVVKLSPPATPSPSPSPATPAPAPSPTPSSSP